MKKSVIFHIAVLIVGIVAIIAAVTALLFHRGIFTLYDNTINGEFSINEDYFQEVINYEFLSEETEQKWAKMSEEIGPIEDAKTARRAAMDIWLQIFDCDIEGERPYKVDYDSENEVWYVCGTLHIHSVSAKGGVAKILIDKNGDIISVWHEK